MLAYRVESMVKQYNFVLPRGTVLSDQDVSWVRVAVDVAELEDHVGVHLADLEDIFLEY